MEAASKKKRGRPAFRRDMADIVVKPAYPHIKSDRHRQNILFENDAVRELKLLDFHEAVTSGEEPSGDASVGARFAWLADYLAAERGKRGAIKHTILTELGRLLESHGSKMMRAVAHRICEIKPSGKEGAAIVRRLRLNKSPTASAANLSDILCKTIDDYLAVHPDLTNEDVHIAIIQTWDLVKRSLGQETEDTSE